MKFSDFKHWFLYKFDNRLIHECPDCWGDGHETCWSPDHGNHPNSSRIGCPVCGNDKMRKVKGGEGQCESCKGKGIVNYKIWYDWRDS